MALTPEGSGELIEELRGAASPEKARILSGFFKTGMGQYGEGDIFLGIPVPVQRRIASKYTGLSLEHIQRLLRSDIHEFRFTALILLTGRFGRADEKEKERVFRVYIKNTGHINSWDLVDMSAPKIAGPYLENRDRKVLFDLSGSGSVWERRIAIVATLHFIRKGDYATTLEIAEKLIDDGHDLINKASGWMLREIGKRDIAAETVFLDRYAAVMNRTMLRYALEKFSPEKRKYYLSLKGKIG